MYKIKFHQLHTAFETDVSVHCTEELLNEPRSLPFVRIPLRRGRELRGLELAPASRLDGA